jgi:hypothetical protein
MKLDLRFMTIEIIFRSTENKVRDAVVAEYNRVDVSTMDSSALVRAIRMHRLLTGSKLRDSKLYCETVTGHIPSEIQK